VAEAKDGAEAVQALRGRSFDVVLMDKNLPGSGGLELLPELLMASPGSRVIMMTAFGDVPSYVEAFEKGATGYLFKPFRTEELKAAIQQASALDAVSQV
jgi:DNA-binding NtrC family response regulator